MTTILILITILFAIVLIARAVTPLKVCALCAAVALTWLGLLVLWARGAWIDTLILALLMGGSIVGIMYVAEQRIPERYLVFRLPYYLTAVALAYTLLAQARPERGGIVLLALVWVVAGTLFVARTESPLGRIAARIIACCKNW